MQICYRDTGALSAMSVDAVVSPSQQWRKKTPHAFDEIPHAFRPGFPNRTIGFQFLHPGIDLSDGTGIVDEHGDFVVQQ